MYPQPISEVGWTRFYPEIEQQKGLAAAILADESFADTPIEILPGWPNKYGYATLGAHNRTVQIACAVAHRLFIVQFTDSRVIYAKVGLIEMEDLRCAVRSWLVERVALKGLQALYPKLEVTPQGLAFESGRGLEFQWSTFLTAPESAFKLLAEVAAKNQELRKLFPFRSGPTFRFSRSTGWPYDYDLPYIRVAGDGKYQAMASAPHLTFPEVLTGGTILVEGTADEAVSRLATEISAFAIR